MSAHIRASALATVIVAGLASAPATAPRPGTARGAVFDGEPVGPTNVLLLMADDLGIDALGVYGIGEDPPPTPNLELLARSGVVFRNAWAQPTCSPTRAAVQTGRFGFRTSIGYVISSLSGGPALPMDEVLLPEMLDLGTGARYAHAAFGKWHLGTSQVGGPLAPNFAGYAHFAGSLEGQIADYWDWDKVVDGTTTHVRRYNTSETVDDALAWIQGHEGPWFCSIAFQAPHAPFHRPPAELHTRALPLSDPSPWCGAAGGDPRPFVDAAIEALDSEIGRLIAGIPAGVRARTTVIFLGDNGTDSCVTRPPVPYNRAKGSLYEGGVRVPLLVAGARVLRTGDCRALVQATDVFATVAELAGVDLAATLPDVPIDSVSLVPYLTSPRRPSLRRWLYSEVFTPNGPGNPHPLPPCPDEPVCQVDLGLDGPGSVELAICGAPLYGRSGANSVPVRLTGAPPGAQCTLFIGTNSPAFRPELGGWTISNPPSAAQTFQASAAGVVERSIWTGGTSRELHYQFVVADPAEPLGWAISNAVRITPLWTDMQAVRGARYKLLRFDPCREELYDLARDPLEQVNLLAAPLMPAVRVAYDALVQQLETLR